MRRAIQTFHFFTSEGVRTIAAGMELADDDPAVIHGNAAYFVPVPDPVEQSSGDQAPAETATPGEAPLEPAAQQPPADEPPAKPTRHTTSRRQGKA